MVAIARYEDYALAQHHADMLTRRGMRAELRDATLDELIREDHEATILLLVEEGQVEAAEAWLDAIEDLPMAQASSPRETIWMVGAFLAMIGILLSFIPTHAQTQDIEFIPFALLFTGGALFFRGLMLDHEAG